MARWLVTGVSLAAAALLAVSLGTLPTSAAFTAATAASANSLRVAALRDTFQVTPGTAVQPGTSTAIATGDVDTLSLAVGTVPSARTIASVFTVKNVSAQSATAVLALTGAPQLSSVSFASSGTATATLAAGASTTVSITTSSTVAGHGAGTLRLRLGGSTWLYRDYGLTIDEAPEAPLTLSATAKAAGKVQLSWAASTTTTNLGGYDVYRAVGAGAPTKLTATPLAVGTTTYLDSATTDGTAYTYTVKAVSSGTPTLTSVASPGAAATADATAPSQPTSVAIANGGGTGNNFVNLANRGSVNFNVVLPAGSVAADTVTVVVSDGSSQVSGTVAGGATTVTVTGLNLTALGDATLTITATSTDAAGNVSTARTATVQKDTVAPAAPTGAYTDNKQPTTDSIAGTAEASATVRATQTAPTASGPYTATASTGGAYTVLVANVKGVTVGYSVTATDAAGNTGPALTLSFADAK